jgi:hypothetical protein
MVSEAVLGNSFKNSKLKDNEEEFEEDFLDDELIEDM